MPANTAPIFTVTPNVGAVDITAANTKSDGAGTVGTDIFKAFTAGANGSWVSKVKIQPTASVAATSTTGTVCRVFLSTVSSGVTTTSNTHCIAEMALPVQSADHSTAATVAYEIPLNIAIPTGMYIHVTTHHIPATNTSNKVTVYGGDY